MSYSSGEAAEQVVRMTLNGVEVAAKISGKAAERLAVLLYAVLKDQKKTRRSRKPVWDRRRRSANSNAHSRGKRL